MSTRSSIVEGHGWALYEDMVEDTVWLRVDDEFSAHPGCVRVLLAPAVIDAIRAAPARAFPHLRGREQDAAPADKAGGRKVSREDIRNLVLTFKRMPVTCRVCGKACAMDDARYIGGAVVLLCSKECEARLAAMDCGVRLGIEVEADDGDACRGLLRRLCDMIDADLAGSPAYDISTMRGSVVCKVKHTRDLVSTEKPDGPANEKDPPSGPEPARVTQPGTPPCATEAHGDGLRPGSMTWGELVDWAAVLAMKLGAIRKATILNELQCSSEEADAIFDELQSRGIIDRTYGVGGFAYIGEGKKP